ncbi:MAG TPA: flagellar hook-associated protein FlgK [Burkholderiaceae bacterium]|jgi:flagellar hook-associated protein 1 FlgK|nr:flagellar hook-associated protein FlgK [Burkholderiaceae bacterium]
MSGGLFSIGSSALNAAYTALQTAGNNIANANTPGYSREIVDFTAQVETGLSGNYIGQGVAVESVTRQYNQLLTQQVDLAQSASSQADAHATLLNQVNNLFSSTTGGLGAVVNQFFSQIQTLTQQPGNLAVRQSVLSSAQQMAASFNDAYSQLQQMQQSANQQIGQQISTVNSATAQIAKLNDQIALATSAGGSPNQLLDQRDQAIKTLNQSIGVTTMAQSDGSINVFLADGQPLVVGDQVTQMGMGTDPSNPQNVTVGTKAGNTIVPLSVTNTGGGDIGALMQFSLQDVPAVQNQIGRLAVAVSSQFNQQSQLGQDSNGAPGVNLFSTLSPTVIASTTNATSGGAPAETVTATFSDPTQLQASDYRLQVVGGQYHLTRLSDGQQTTLSSLPGTPATVDGITFSVTGTATNGDSFTIEPVRTGAGNLAVSIGQPQQIAAASPVRASIASTDTGSLSVLSLSVTGPNRNANLTHSVNLSFTSPTSYTLTDSTNGATSSGTYTAGQPIAFNGWSLTLLGTPATGDSVSVGANTGGTGDNTNALALAQLQNANVVGGTSLGSGYAAVVAQVGTMTANAQADQQNQQTILQNAQNAQSAVAGVNLDQEAASLLQYQQQYQAAAKVISIASTLFDQILSIASSG